jgi:hypothetical protein
MGLEIPQASHICTSSATEYALPEHLRLYIRQTGPLACTKGQGGFILRLLKPGVLHLVIDHVLQAHSKLTPSLASRMLPS